MTHHCPTCGAAVADKIDISVITDECSNNEKKIIEALAETYPNKIHISRLVHAVYWDDRDGGPLAPENAISALISRMRKKLRKHGWTIPNSRIGRGMSAKYCLERIQ